MLPAARLRRRATSAPGPRPRSDGRPEPHELRSELESTMLREAREEVISADQKASVVLAVLGIGFGAALSGPISGEWHPRDLGSWSQAMWWTGISLGTLAIVFAGSAVWPRYNARDVNGGIHYWGHAARFARLADLSDALDRMTPKPDERVRHQLWRLSRVVARKYTSVRLAMLTAVASAALLLASALAG